MNGRDQATIMLVDDDRDFLTLTKRILEGEGYHVDARTRAPSWADLSRSKPVLLYLDIELKGENGVSVCRAIKSHPYWSRLPVILISGHNEDRLKKESTQCKADGYLTKPLGRTLLIQLAAHFTAAFHKHQLPRVPQTPPQMRTPGVGAHEFAVRANSKNSSSDPPEGEGHKEQPHVHTGEGSPVATHSTGGTGRTHGKEDDAELNQPWTCSS